MSICVEQIVEAIIGEVVVAFVAIVVNRLKTNYKLMETQVDIHETPSNRQIFETPSPR